MGQQKKYRNTVRVLKLSLVILSFAISSGIFAQQDFYKLLRSIPMKAEFLTSDELGNFYTSLDNKLWKYDMDGKLLYTYSNLYSGDITFVDVRDPFKVMVYYRDFARLELLDNTLNLTTNTIDLSRLGLELSTLACLSYQNGYWLYYPLNFELIRIDQFLEKTNRSGNISKITGNRIEPNYLLERDNLIYMNDPDLGILIFDKYGTYYKTIGVKGLGYFQVYDRKIIFNGSESFTILNPETMEENTFNLPAVDFKMLSFSFGTKEKRLYLLMENVLHIYSLNKSLE